jgi:hypothetical protein
MLERFGNVLYWVCATVAVVLTAIMLASVLTHDDGADPIGIGITILIGLVHWLGHPFWRVGVAMNAFEAVACSH